MNKFKHTSGEWVDGNTSDSIIVASKIKNDTDKFYGGEVICESVSPKNKPIIKAAPDMLEALIKHYSQVLSIYNQLGAMAGHINLGSNTIQCEIDDLIERATGLPIEEVIK